VAADAWTLDAAHGWWEQHQPLCGMDANIAGPAAEDRTLTGIVSTLRSRLEAQTVTRSFGD